MLSWKFKLAWGENYSKNRKIRAKVDSRIYGRWRLRVMGSCKILVCGCGLKFFTTKVKSAYEPSGPSGRSLSRFPQHEATKSIATPPLDGVLVHCRVTPSIKFASTHLYTWVERGTVSVKCLVQEHNVPDQGSNPDRSTRRRVH